MSMLNPLDARIEGEEVDPTDLGFTLYGPIPIFIPQDIIEGFHNLISEYQTSDSATTSVVTAAGHEVTIDGWIAGKLKKLFKESLIQIRNVQAGLGEPVFEQLQSGEAIFKGSKYIGALPFVTDMAFEVDMLIRDLEFGHHTETKDAYRIRLTLRQQRVSVDWKQQLKKNLIRAGIIAAAPMIRSLISFLSEFNFSSFKESDFELNRDLNGGWSLPLIPTIDPTPRSTSEIVEIPSEMEKMDYNVNPNLEIGFDSSYTWYKLPIQEKSEYPQHFSLQSNSDIYEIILQIIPLKDEKYLKIRIEKDGEILFSQRVNESVVYKIDRDRNSNGDLYFKMVFGFMNLDMKLTRIYPKGNSSIINGVVRFESS